MKVVYRGSKPSIPIYEVECKDCKSRMHCTKDELEYAGRQYNDVYYSFVCPVCGTKNYIDEIDLEEKKVVADG